MRLAHQKHLQEFCNMTYRTNLFLSAIFLILIGAVPSGASAQESYFEGQGCTGCHQDDDVSCNACHAHGTHSGSAKSDINITATTNKTVFSRGEEMSVTINGGYRTGWIRATLYDDQGNALGRSSGPCNNMALVDHGCGGGEGYPVVLTAPAPTIEGVYQYQASWYGSSYDPVGLRGNGWKTDPSINDTHGEEIIATNSFTVIPTDLSVSIAITADSTTVGSPITYDVSVKNNGSQVAHSVILTVTLPSQLAYKSSTQGCSESEGVVTCSLGDASGGSSALVNIEATVETAESFTATASVASDSFSIPASDELETTITTSENDDTSGNANTLSGGGAVGFGVLLLLLPIFVRRFVKNL
jgi:uncharacterized repeat protein (TIGR01451 family)